VLVRSLDDVEPQTRRVIEEELAAQEFIPRITAVTSVDDQFDVMAWQVETDRGPIELQIKGREDIRQLDDGRVVIKDHAGGMFEVADVSALDPRSRLLVEDQLS
jgi:carbon monoxide dehydrogenase subunit G